MFALFTLGGQFAYAATYYQQLTDSSESVQFTGAGCVIVGSFSVAGTVNVVAGDSGFTVAQIINANSPTASKLVLSIYSANNCTGPVGDYASGPFGNASTTDAELFLDLSATGSFTLSSGATYYVSATGVDSPIDYKIRTNLSKSFFYGYFTDFGGVSLGIVPGVSGYTDVGISTTSQQVYCYQNFASTTGFLDSLGASVSQGVCNVAVFLFVPSSIAIANWQNLGSSTKSRIPFSYMYEAAAAYSTLTASSSNNFINVSLDMSSWASSSLVTLPSQWVVLSTSTVSQYYPDPIRITFRALMATALYLGLALWLYRKGQRALHKPV